MCCKSLDGSGLFILVLWHSDQLLRVGSPSGFSEVGSPSG